MKAGFIQFAPEFCNYDENLSKVERLLNEAGPADLLVLPELSNSGYNFVSKEQAFENSEKIEDSKFISLLENFCEKRKNYVVAGFNERDGQKLYNSSVLVGPGGYVGKYRKLHLFLNEKDIFEPGNAGLPVFNTDIGKIGMLVCFDWFFPEVWRILAIKGADVICHSSNLVLPGFAQSAVPIHALTNHVYVITSNRIGTEKNLTFTGISTIASPKGKVLYQAGEDNEEKKICDLDLSMARDKNITPRNNMFGDRRPELYRELIDYKYDENNS